MQIKNNYDKEVFNGDIGMISDKHITITKRNTRLKKRLEKGAVF
ncbi:MAG: hypothetical protein IKI37_00990 [Oscillospiraceae bacterium]|nr:hypothetical protein [Oscillospiraceae bacterium]